MYMCEMQGSAVIPNSHKHVIHAKKSSIFSSIRTPEGRHRRLMVVSRSCSQSSSESNDSKKTSNVWQRVGAAAAAAVLSLQATLPLAALAVADAEFPPLIITPDVMESLPPLPTKFPPLSPLRLPKMQQLVLKNGLRVILLEDKEAPLVRGTLMMRGGQRASPPNKIGLASIAAAVQRSGGSVAYPGSSLDGELEDLAAAIEGGGGSDSVSMGFSCLEEDAPRVLQLFSEVITTPALPASKLELYKTQFLNSIAHKNDNSSSIPGREVAKLIYGRDSPYAREPTIAQLSTFSIDDVSAWLTAWERPDTAVLGLVGSFNPREMKKQLEESMLVKEWTPPTPLPLELPTPPLPSQEPLQGKIYIVDRPGSSQASVVMAEVGIQMMDEDEVALDVLSGILNNFGGKLFDELRTSQGLAYSVSGGWASAPIDHPGLFIASAETVQPAALLFALRQALTEAATVAPTVEQVERAREESLNSFIFGFSSTVAQLRRAVAFQLFGLPQDYLFTYRDKLSAVTAEDILAAAGRHLHPDKMVTVVVGDAKSIRPQIEKAMGVAVEILELEEEPVELIGVMK